MQQQKPRLSAIDQDVLTLLQGRELYGLEILERLNNGRPKTMIYGSLYPALNRLVDKELVECRWGNEVDGPGARRKYYKVTALGVEVLEQVQAYRKGLAKR